MPSGKSPPAFKAPGYLPTHAQYQNQPMANEAPPAAGSKPPPVPPPLRRKDPFRFKTVQKEHHGEPTYCIDWSSDIYYEEPDDDDSENSVMLIGDNENCFRIIATCGGRHVNIYKVETGSKRESRKAPLDWIQSYLDADRDEQYYACAFAGRSVELTEEEAMQIDKRGRDAAKSATRKDSESRRPIKLQRRNPMETENDANEKPKISPNWPLSGETGTGSQMLCVAGHKAVIQVIDTSRQELAATLVGHGMEIYDLKVSPVDEFVIISGSKDNSARLWNLKTGAQIAMIQGHEGHLDDVVSIAWHPSGKYLATGSMDTTVKLWDIGPNTPVHAAIQESHNAAKQFVDGNYSCQVITRPAEQSIPIFTSHKMHYHCVDCVAFWGDCLLSRSQEDVIFLWEPEDFDFSPVAGKFTVSPGNSNGGVQGTPQEKLPYPVPSAYRHLRSFVYAQSNFWFVRFAVDHSGQTLAAGNGVGEIYIWDLKVDSNRGGKAGADDESSQKPEPLHKLTVDPKYQSNSIRYMAFSPDDDFLVAVSDSGLTFKWEVRREHVSS